MMLGENSSMATTATINLARAVQSAILEYEDAREQLAHATNHYAVTSARVEALARIWTAAEEERQHDDTTPRYTDSSSTRSRRWRARSRIRTDSAQSDSRRIHGIG
jgi:hypothetical protein